MRKVLISVLLMCLAYAVFADDATVLPQGVARLTIANTYMMWDEEFDTDGKVQDASESSFYNLGGALEFGINDTISAALQWAPGTMLYGKIDGYDDAVYDGLADLFVGAKIQAVGPNGFVENNKIRFAFAPGVAVPLDSYDAETELEAVMAGDDFRLSSQSETESLGLGLRLYFDYMITEDFYVNLYNQTKYYLPNEKYTVMDVLTYAGSLNKSEYEYPVYLDFELDFNYDLYITDKTKFGFGLPVKYSMKGETTVNGVGQDDADYSVAIDPSVSFFTAESIPFEVVLDYYMTLAGENVSKMSYVGLQLKLFYDFY